MPQMKGMKELRLLVQQLKQGRYGGDNASLAGLRPLLPYLLLSFYICLAPFFAPLREVPSLFLF
jgi:hypothetical protein